MQKTVDGVTTTIVFEYNEDGLRTKKTVTVGNTTTVTEYVLHGKNVVHLTRGTDELHFYYDAQDRPAVVIFNGVAYGYLYNLQGDVVALVDGTGAKVVEYTYDAWGKPTSKTGSLASTLGTVQPFRYRGYVWDEETGDYYLRSRYFVSWLSRFLSADAMINGNLYCYCNDSPPNQSDLSGRWPSYNPLINYIIYKPFYSELGNAFLKLKGWKITNKLYQHAIWGNGSNYPNSVRDHDELSSKIAENQEFRTYVGNKASNLQPGESMELVNDRDLEFTDGDLHYALQHVTLNGTVSKDLDGHWFASLTVSDEFNFDKERLDWSSFGAFINSTSLSNAANDFGLSLQYLKIIKPFLVEVHVDVNE